MAAVEADGLSLEKPSGESAEGSQNLTTDDAESLTE